MSSVQVYNNKQQQIDKTNEQTNKQQQGVGSQLFMIQKYHDTSQ